MTAGVTPRDSAMSSISSKERQRRNTSESQAGDGEFDANEANEAISPAKNSRRFMGVILFDPVARPKAFDGRALFLLFERFKNTTRRVSAGFV